MRWQQALMALWDVINAEGSLAVTQGIVVAVYGLDLVVTGPAIYVIHTVGVACVDKVVAVAGVHLVVAFAGEDLVVAVATPEVVVAAVALEVVLPAPAPEAVGPAETRPIIRYTRWPFLNRPSAPSCGIFGAYSGERNTSEARIKRMSEQAQRVENKNIPEWAQGLYYSSGITSEVMVYYDDEAIYFEHKGKDSGIVRFTFEQIEGLKRVEEEQEESTDSPQ